MQCNTSAGCRQRSTTDSSSYGVRCLLQANVPARTVPSATHFSQLQKGWVLSRCVSSPQLFTISCPWIKQVQHCEQRPPHLPASVWVSATLLACKLQPQSQLDNSRQLSSSDMSWATTYHKPKKCSQPSTELTRCIELRWSSDWFHWALDTHSGLIQSIPVFFFLSLSFLLSSQQPNEPEQYHYPLFPLQGLLGVSERAQPG